MLMRLIDVCGRQSLLSFMEKAKGSLGGVASGFGFPLLFIPCCLLQLLGILELTAAIVLFLNFKQKEVFCEFSDFLNLVQ